MSTDPAQKLAQRYGAPQPWRRRALLLASVAVILLAAAWVLWAGWSQIAPSVTSNIETFEVQGEHSVTATVVVSVRDKGVEATCLARAFAEDHTNVGEVEFTPDPQDGEQGGRRQTIEIRTEREATAVELLGCRTEDDPRYR